MCCVCEPGEFVFQCHIFWPFHTVHGILKARILEWFASPCSSGPCLVRALLCDPYALVLLRGMSHSILELQRLLLHKAVIYEGGTWEMRKEHLYNIIT